MVLRSALAHRLQTHVWIRGSASNHYLQTPARLRLQFSSVARSTSFCVLFAALSLTVDKQMHPIPPFVHMNQKHAEPPGWNGKPQGEPRSLDGQRHLDGQRTRWNHPGADWKPVEWATQIDIAAQSPNQIVQREDTHTDELMREVLRGTT